jgi:HEXXH motif-containing protein
MKPGLYRLPSADFNALAGGAGGAGTVELLRGGQLSKHTLMVRAVVDQSAATAPGDHAIAHLDDAYALLSAAQRSSPGAVEALLLHPNVGAWAVHCLQRLHGTPDGETPLWADLGYLAAVAASAAITARSAFEIDVPACDGLAMLPAIGAARVAPDEQWTAATVRSDGARTHITAQRGVSVAIPPHPYLGAPGWLGLRRLSAAAGGLEIQVDLDDLDPCRGHAYPSVGGRLDEEQVGMWRRLFAEAWALLVAHHRSYAVALAAGLRSLVPQVSIEPGHSISATSTDAFGSIALSLPPDPVTFALALVHEFQHAKLSALLDLAPLHHARPDVRYYAPWRDDPRPLGGLLQGVYAFLGVTDFWRMQRYQDTTSGAALAHFEFARWREQTRRAVDELSASPDLTERGRRLVDGVRAALAGWDREQVPPALADQAQDSAMDHRARWRMRNIKPDPGLVSTLAGAWQADAPRPRYAEPCEIVSGGPPDPGDTVRLRLWHLRMTEPERFQRLCAGERADPLFAGVTAADIAYIHGDYHRAARLYREQIDADPGPAAPWVGLALARLRDGDTECAAALLAHPELLRAVYGRVREEAEPVNPESLARWLDNSAVGAGKDTA